MDWIDRMEIAYEAQTHRMIDEMYGPKPIECAMCEEYFSSDDALTTKYNPKLDFCSDDCVDRWEEEFAHEYEEGGGSWTTSQPATQTSVHPTIHQSKKQVNYEQRWI